MSENVKINLNKKQKKVITIVASVIAVIIALLVVVLANKTTIYTKGMFALMPESVNGEVNGEPIVFYIEYNKDFNPKTDKQDPMLAFCYYYFDDDGNKVDLGPDGTIEDGGEDVPVSAAFLPYFMDNLLAFKDKLVIVGVVALIIVGAIGIVIWFILWSKKEDRQKAEKYGKKNNKKRKK